MILDQQVPAGQQDGHDHRQHLFGQLHAGPDAATQPRTELGDLLERQLRQVGPATERGRGAARHGWGRKRLLTAICVSEISAENSSNSYLLTVGAVTVTTLAHT